jgi:uncharacterized protein (DUF885 family)
MRAYIARIDGVARAIGQYVERAKLAAAEGVHAPRFADAAVLEQAHALVTGAPFDGAGDARSGPTRRRRSTRSRRPERSTPRLPTSCAPRRARRSSASRPHTTR